MLIMRAAPPVRAALSISTDPVAGLPPESTTTPESVASLAERSTKSTARTSVPARTVTGWASTAIDVPGKNVGANPRPACVTRSTLDDHLPSRSNFDALATM
jgi:hypothetical protein